MSITTKSRTIGKLSDLFGRPDDKIKQAILILADAVGRLSIHVQKNPGDAEKLDSEVRRRLLPRDETPPGSPTVGRLAFWGLADHAPPAPSSLTSERPLRAAWRVPKPQLLGRSGFVLTGASRERRAIDEVTACMGFAADRGI